MEINRIKETKYLVFSAEEVKGRKTKIIHIINKSSVEEIGTIEWYSSWRQYCFIASFMFDTVWNKTCLMDIIEVIDMLMKERTVKKPDWA